MQASRSTNAAALSRLIGTVYLDIKLLRRHPERGRRGFPCEPPPETSRVDLWIADLAQSESKSVQVGLVPFQKPCVFGRPKTRLSFVKPLQKRATHFCRNAPAGSFKLNNTAGSGALLRTARYHLHAGCQFKLRGRKQYSVCHRDSGLLHGELFGKLLYPTRRELQIYASGAIRLTLMD